MKLQRTKNIMIECVKKLKCKPVVLYGAGGCGIAYFDILAYYGVEVRCFCDDDLAKQNTLLRGIEIISLHEMRKNDNDYYIVISSYGPHKLLNNLIELGLDDKVIDVDLCFLEYELDYYDYYIENYSEVIQAYNLLADAKSKMVFQNIINYKISGDRKLIQEISDEAEQQYVDKNIVNFLDDEVLVDIGAFNGDTVERFIRNIGTEKYKKIIAIEADSSNYIKLQKNTSHYGNIKYINIGVYSQKGKLGFDGNNLGASAIKVISLNAIDVDKLDNLLKDKEVTFIKADIEGAEKDAIYGAEEIIKKCKPKLAFCVYHRKEDIFKIPLLLSQFNPQYRLYMRHYNYNATETVIYAI